MINELGSACTTSCVLRELLNDPDEYIQLSMTEFLNQLAAKRDQAAEASTEKAGAAMEKGDKVVVSVVYPSFRASPPPGGFGIMTATTMGTDHHSFVLRELEDKGVVAVPVMIASGNAATKKFVFPESRIIVSKNTGSHTVIQARNLPDIKCNDFIDSLTYIAGIAEKERKTKIFWFHFEGRNIDETKLMISEVHSIWKGRADTEYFVSLEIASNQSSAKEELLLIPSAQIIIVSKSYLTKMKYLGPEDFLDKILAVPEIKPAQGSVFFFPNGSKGSSAIRLAYGIRQEATSPAYEGATSKGEMFDTVGARDAFIAGVIYAMGHRKIKKLQDILDLVNRIASASISRHALTKE
jgi:hypothetical protein